MSKYFINKYSMLCGADENTLLSVKIRPSLRVNTIKISEKELVNRLTKKGVKLEKIPYLTAGYYYKAPFSLGATPEYLLGYYYLQEAASQLPVELLSQITSLEGKRVLDCCAAPGSKTTQLAMHMKNTGEIIALDSSPKRLRALCNNLERCGVKNTTAILKDALYVSDLDLVFDAVILDAPCSGNYASDNNWFKKRKQYDPLKQARLQIKLLNSSLAVLKPQGILVYSTCSLEPEENELVINTVLDKAEVIKINCPGDPGITEYKRTKLNPQITNTKRLWPHKHGTQGFFIAILRKNK